MGNAELPTPPEIRHSPFAIRYSTFRFARPQKLDFAAIGGRRAAAEIGK
jgi:hypothetical protein